MGRYDGLGSAIIDAIKGVEGDPGPTGPAFQSIDGDGSYVLQLLEKQGIQTKGISINSGEYFAALGKADMSKVLAEDAALRKARDDRAQSYGISIKDGGHITKPGGLEDVEEDQFADPVNLVGILISPASIDEAEKLLDGERYTEQEKSLIRSRIEKQRAVLANSREKFKDQDVRSKHSGIARKTVPSYAPGVSDPVDGSELEPTAYADFTHYQFRIDTPDAVKQARADWDACKRFNPSLYDERETAQIENAIALAERHVKAGDKPQMQDCPNCGKPVPEGTKTCPHCGKPISGGDDGDGDEPPQAKQARPTYAQDVDVAAAALKAAYASGNREAIVAATKSMMLLSAEASGRQDEIKKAAVQGILEHALYMGATVPEDYLSGPHRADKGIHINNVTEALQRERDSLAAELATVKAAGGDAAALERVKAADQEAERLRGELDTVRKSKDALQSEFSALSTRLREVESRNRPAATSRKSVSVGTPGTARRTGEVREVEMPPQTFDELRRKRAEGAR